MRKDFPLLGFVELAYDFVNKSIFLIRLKQCNSPRVFLKLNNQTIKYGLFNFFFCWVIEEGYSFLHGSSSPVLVNLLMQDLNLNMKIWGQPDTMEEVQRMVSKIVAINNNVITSLSEDPTLFRP